MARRDFDPPPRTFTKPPIRREYDPRAVRQDLWARWIGRCLALALVPLVLAGTAARWTGLRRLPDEVTLLVGACALVGFGGAVVVIAMWAVADRP